MREKNEKGLYKKTAQSERGSNCHVTTKQMKENANLFTHSVLECLQLLQAVLCDPSFSELDSEESQFQKQLSPAKNQQLITG